MTVERHPKPNRVVGGSSLDPKIVSLLDKRKKLARWSKAPHALPKKIKIIGRP
jgi:hypothetical protein